MQPSLYSLLLRSVSLWFLIQLSLVSVTLTLSLRDLEWEDLRRMKTPPHPCVVPASSLFPCFPTHHILILQGFFFLFSYLWLNVKEKSSGLCFSFLFSFFLAFFPFYSGVNWVWKWQANRCARPLKPVKCCVNTRFYCCSEWFHESSYFFFVYTKKVVLVRF